MALERFCYYQTGGFRLSKASTLHLYDFSSPFIEPPCNLDQPFHYLGKGVQFYVFVGEDRQTILKLFKHHHSGLSTDNLKKVLPDWIIAPILERREKRVTHLFRSSLIALQQLSEETAILYTHLNKSDDQLGTTKIFDKLGIVHNLNLDQTEFIIQKRAKPLEEGLHELFSTNQVEEAISRMQKLAALIETRRNKGIKNKDRRILRNCGFLNDAPLEIDVGSYVYAKKTTPLKAEKEKKKAIWKLLNWVEDHYPEHLQQSKDGLLHEVDI